MEKTRNLTKKIVESSLMVAFATVLSLLKLIEMPYGGSVTLASMLPLVIVGYRHGVGTGLSAGLVYAVIQQLLGLNNLSYVTGWQSVIAVIMLDYIVAFTVVGLGGIFRNKLTKLKLSASKNQGAEIATGMAFVCILRYLCHTVAGATVWAGLSIPTEAALVYSIGYNATYMLPETIVSVLVGAWIGSVIDFSKNTPTRFLPVRDESKESRGACEFLPHIAGAVAIFGVAFDTLLIAPHLQDAESGEFTFAYLSEVNWILLAVVTALCVLTVIALSIASRIGKKQSFC